MKFLMEKLAELIGKHLVIGHLSVSVGTIAATAATVLLVGGTAVAAVSINTQNAEHRETVAVVEMQEGAASEDSESLDNSESGKEETGSSTRTDADEATDTETEELLETAHLHNLTTEVISESTCTVSGSATERCSECDYVRTYKLPLKAHNGANWIIEKAAMETAEGLQTLHCDACGTLMATEVIAIIPHTHNYVVTGTRTANCNEGGYTEYTCSICNSSYTDSTSSAGHQYSGQTVEGATCTKEGHIYSKCSVCGDTTETGIIGKLPHNFNDWQVVTEADCITNGSEKRDCKSCGQTENRNIQALGHVPNADGKNTTTEPTCTTKGKAQYTCEVCTVLVKEEIPALGHEYGEPVIVDSTCSAEGNKKYTCQRNGCGHFYEEVINKKDHTEGDWIVDTQATCTNTGTKHTECTVCHAHIKEQTIPATGHSFGAWSEATAPVCEQKGTEKRSCSACAMEETRDIPALEHNYIQKIDQAATCTASGTKHMECSLCGKRQEEQTILATGHTYTNYVLDTPATDLVEGSKTATCDNGCGTTDTKVIPKLPHTHNYETETSRVEPTCTADGYYILTCKCNATTRNDLTKTGHTYENTSHTEANCILEGKDTFACTKCSDTYSNTISALGHTSGGWETTKEPTDLVDGEKVRKCTSCGTTLETQVISKLPHTCEFNTLLETQKATCTTDGYKLYQCKCGLTDKTILRKTNHANSEWKVIKEASYTEMGLEQNVCKDCGYVVESKDIAVLPHEHNYQVTSTKNPTCTEAGNTTTTCSMCGNTKIAVLPATGHKESTAIVDAPATCTAEGTNHTECSVCHTKLSDGTIPATGHTEGNFITDTAATCTNSGSKHTQCEVCTATIKTETIPAKGHSMGNWSQTSAPACEAAGTEEKSCGNCSYKENRSIPALGHDYGNWIIDVPPTEGNEGSKHKECSRCDSEIIEEIEQLPPHVHEYTVTGTTDSTCTSTGSTKYSCGCGDSYSEEIVKKPHTSGEWVVKTPATEEATGLEVKNCTVCGTETDSRVINKLEHVHNYTTDSKAATCTVDGYEKKTCTCGSVVNKVIPATGHQYGEAVVVQPTCTTGGTSTITCSVCSNKEVTDIAATGHNYVEKSKVPASCEAAGTITTECENCKDAKETTIPKLEHSYSETSVIDATCTEGGYTIETCVNCGDTKKTKETVALGHTEGALETVKEAELGVKGLQEQKCTLCNAVLKTEEIPMLLTDGTDSVYWFENYVDGKYVQEMAIGHYDKAQADEMYEMINEYRVSIGKKALTRTNDYMKKYVDLRAVETSYLWDHARPNRTATECPENIAGGIIYHDGSSPTVKQVFDAWMNSEGHKHNIEFGFSNNMTGVSVFYKKSPIINAPGRYVYIAYWVQTFR